MSPREERPWEFRLNRSIRSPSLNTSPGENNQRNMRRWHDRVPARAGCPRHSFQPPDVQRPPLAVLRTGNNCIDRYFHERSKCLMTRQVEIFSIADHSAYITTRPQRR